MHLLLRGAVDPAAEIAKLQKKKDQVNKSLGDLRKKMAAPDY